MTIVVTADIVGSRLLDDRAAAQRAIEDAVADVEEHIPAARPLTATSGDELQGEYAHLDDALRALLLLRLRMPEDVDCRYGVGVGATTTVPSRGGALPEGPGWWAARAAIEHVHALQDRRVPHARTWVVAADDEPASVRAALGHINAYLLARDAVVGDMSARVRRLVYGRCLGRTQRELADAEQITQSAVSQALAAAGAGALVEGFDLLGTPDGA